MQTSLSVYINVTPIKSYSILKSLRYLLTVQDAQRHVTLLCRGKYTDLQDITNIPLSLTFTKIKSYSYFYLFSIIIPATDEYKQSLKYCVNSYKMDVETQVYKDHPQLLICELFLSITIKPYKNIPFWQY